MALPALNNSNTIANLPMDANSISQAVLTAASRTGHLQIYNNGTIAFNNNISGGSAPSASRESGGLGYSGISLLSEIRNYLESINSNITRFIETSQRQTEITQNLLEAQNAKRDIEGPRTEVQEKGMDFKKTFQDFFDSMKDSFSGITGGMKGGLMGGLMGGLLRGVFGFILKGFGAVFGAYLVAKGIGKIPIGNGQTIGDKIKELTEDAYNFVSSMGENGSSSGGFAEPGENADVGGGTAPSSAPAGGTAPSSAPAGGTAPSSAPAGGTAPSSPPATTRAAPTTTRSTRTSTPARNIITNGSEYATEADLSGLKFQDHTHSKHGRLPPEIEKQILKSLAQRMQYIRKKMGGRSFKILSGYRPSDYNKRISGAAKDSQHTHRKAVDVSKETMSSEKDQKLFVKSAVESGIGGIGFYQSFIHIDIRPRTNGRISRWGAIPKWAYEYINNPGKYTIDESAGVVEEKEDTHKEENENKDTGSLGQPKEQPTQDQSSPSTGNVPKQKEPTADRVEPSSETGGEEEEEGEETSEKVQEDPSLTRKTAVKVNKKQTSKKGSAQEAMDFFSKHWTKEQAAGIVGNLQFESSNSFDPHQKQRGGGPGYGIAQWERPRQNLFKKIMGKDIRESTFQDQLNFVQWELTHGVYKSAGNAIKNTKTVKEATLAFRAFYEIPGKNNNPNKPHPSDKQRIQYAQNAFGGISEEPQLADQQPSTEGGAARPTTEGGSAQQEPTTGTGESVAQQAREAVEETAGEAWEWSKEKLKGLMKELPSRDTINKITSVGINEIYDIMGVDPRKRVKIGENGKVVPYTQDTATQQPAEGQGGIPPQAMSETASQESSEGQGALATPMELNNTTRTGEAIYTSSLGVRTGEQQLIQGKVDASKSQPTIVNNITGGGEGKGNGTAGVMGAVPSVRQKMDSTLEEAQYRSIRGTGIV